MPAAAHGGGMGGMPPIGREAHGGICCQPMLSCDISTAGCDNPCE